jgi:hypothetical protein
VRLTTPLPVSELTGQPVSTWSEEWRIETEARAILKMSEDQRDVFFNGRKDEDGRSIDRGLIGIRAQQAAEKIMETVRQLAATRAERK